MIHLEPAVLEGRGIRLEPLSLDHEPGLGHAAADGSLWELWFTSVPRRDGMRRYIEDALEGQREGHMLPWAVVESSRGTVIGTTRYHDVVPAIDRVEIGYTWYGRRWQRTNVNTTCKLLLLGHAFDTIGCEVVGLRTDSFNFRSQRAIEALGASKDGIIRHSKMRADGSVRDTVMYSILRREWLDVRRHLELRLDRYAAHPHATDPASRMNASRRREIS